MSLLVAGGTVVDIIVTKAPRLPTWPRHSEFTPANLVLLAGAPLVTLGGNGANAAYVAARRGARVALQSNIGNDPLGAMVRGWIAAAGCQLLPSGRFRRTAINVTAANARHARATFFYPGTPPGLPSLRGIPPDTTHFLACGWPHPPFSRLARCFRLLKERNIFTAIDAGPFLGRPWTLAELQPLWSSLSLLLANEYELNAMTQSALLAASLRKVRRHFHGHIVVKRGRQGVLWLPASSCLPQLIPAVKVRALNTVGAGDSFNGALLAALSLKRAFLPALADAAKRAARVVASPQGVLGA